ncbi:MAG: hypothetical protein GWO08_03395 [Gammaproteobacteria bacterium]|nr:hypothetical protein [Gammaproteobacteria bacterium]
MSGKPYLRGGWKGNPYNEDGAPQTGTTYTDDTFGAVPRGDTATTTMGGYWIDQNSGNPVATNAWTATDFGGLCDLCHGTTPDGSLSAGEIDVLNQHDNSGIGWVSGYNGHRNAVAGATGTTGMSASELSARNIFAPRGTGSAYSDDPSQHYNAMNNPGDNGTWGFRGSQGHNYTPVHGAKTPKLMDTDPWGVDEVGTDAEDRFHQFTCSKCHNPHASRLPKLMITNCLDTKHNTWDNDHQVVGNLGSTYNDGRAISNWTSAQNCHRLAGDDPDDTRDSASTIGSGWNTVTPW